MLGDFNDTSFEHHGIRSRFFRDRGKFFVETDGRDGKLTPFEVKYTLGVAPLQQYLVEFPDRRVQALSIAWNSRTKAAGGQRWFHLYPGEAIEHDNPVHWTQLLQNWNHMCAECHSTGVRKNYDAANNRFATTWMEISVGCEACHGQGSRHVAWAREQASSSPFAKNRDPSKGLPVRFDDRAGAVWAIDPQASAARRSFSPSPLRKEVETCGRCHARRSQLSEDWVPGRPLSETHLVAPIARGVYAADGQMRDDEEAYNYAPFKQSAMFATGVTCGDCHEPHSGGLRRAGDELCLGCHPSSFASAAHRHHEEATPAPSCVSCHMPQRSYMIIDRRHDHSFRVPRPDLSAQVGTPNACNDCHTEKTAEWAASAIELWHGPSRKGFQHYAEAFAAAWADKPEAQKLLSAVIADRHVAAVARAGALTELAPRVSAASIALARSGLADPDPMVRLGALDMLENVPPTQLWSSVTPLLALGTFYAQLGLTGEAEAEYRSALGLNPKFAPAAINLADLYRTLGRGREEEAVLRSAALASPGHAGVHHALGLALVRTKRLGEAIGELHRATGLDNAQARFAYVYGIALNSAGRRDEAISVLQENLARHPNDRETLAALVALNRDAGDAGAALEYAKRLAQLFPGDHALNALIKSLTWQNEADPK